jgi:hypothetical protein
MMLIAVRKIDEMGIGPILQDDIGWPKISMDNSVFVNEGKLLQQLPTIKTT